MRVNDRIPTRLALDNSAPRRTVALLVAFLLVTSCGAVRGHSGSAASSAATVSPQASASSSVCANQSRPSPRAFAAMTYVGASHEFLVFGGLDQVAGYLHDTWTWRSGCWTEHTSQTGPTARAHPAMAYDRKRGFVVLTGGDSVTPDGKKSFPHDTWLWDGSSWTQAAASPPTAMPLLTYDDDLQSIILVSFNTLSADGSSFNGAGYQAQIWSWSGALWTKVASPTSGPPSRIQASAAFDPTHHQLLLFGGATDSQTLGDTWTWDGATWTQIHVSNNPSPRADATMAYLDATKTVQLFGGGQSDQWAWNGVAWVRVIPLHTPSVRTGEAAASDGTHLLLFGGADPNGNNDIWAWDGSDWAIQ